MSAKKLALIALWRERINKWRASGKSGSQWCRENQFSVRSLFYWRDRFEKNSQTRMDSPKVATQIKSVPQFTEIKDISSAQPIDSGVSVAFGDIFIHLCKDFDQSVLLRCLQTLRTISSGERL